MLNFFNKGKGKMSGQKIFQIGFNKCGTKSLNRLFKNNDIKGLHFEKGELAISIKNRMDKGEDPIADHKEYTYFTDMECTTRKDIPLIEAYKYYEYFYEWYPDALYILNTRNVENWIKSRLAQGSGNYARCYQRHYNLENTEQVIYRWRLDWFEHHANVLKFFEDKNKANFLIYDIENDDDLKIINFLRQACQIKDDEFPHKGKTKIPKGRKRKQNTDKANSTENQTDNLLSA